MTDTWRTLPEGAAAGLSGNVRGEQAETASTRDEGCSEPHGRSEGFDLSRFGIPGLTDEEAERLHAALVEARVDPVDELRAKVARVEALLDECDAKAFSGTAVITTRLVRAALDGSKT